MALGTPICDFVAQYAASGITRAHMPGHKGVSSLGCEALDITEVAGADALYEADGIIAQSEANATQLFGSGRTLYSTEGSSQCIKAMLYLAMPDRQRNGRPLILAARNVHKSFIYGCALLDLEVDWLCSEQSDERSICSCLITPEQVDARLSAMPVRPFALYLTAPDYLGASPDLAGIARVCRAYGLPLLVDNAHGAYLKFLSPSRHPLDLGATMCCDSAHKTLPALTGGAYLHLSEPAARQAGRRAKDALALFGSTSPSYLILQSLDQCNRLLSEGYPKRLAQTVHRVEALKRALRSGGWEVADTDPLKCTLRAGSWGLSGTELAGALRAGRVECEFADADWVVLMLTPHSSEADLERIERVCLGLPRRSGAKPAIRLSIAPPHRALSIREAVLAPSESVPVERAAGRICAAPAISCPPAVPIALSGEVISPEQLEVFRAYHIDAVEVVRPDP